MSAEMWAVVIVLILGIAFAFGFCVHRILSLERKVWLLLEAVRALSKHSHDHVRVRGNRWKKQS